MIAPIKKTERRRASPRLLHARRLVASTLLGSQENAPGGTPRVSAWRAWLFTAWLVGVVAVYFAFMAGIF